MSLSSLSSIVGLIKFIVDSSGGVPPGPVIKTWSLPNTIGGIENYSMATNDNNIIFMGLNNANYRASVYNKSNGNLTKAGKGVTPGFCYTVINDPNNNNKIYYGGTFNSDFSGNSLYGGIAIYDYSNNIINSLQDQPGFTNINVRCLALDNSGNLYFGGQTTSLNSGNNNCVHMYDGTTTTSVTGGVTAPDNNYAFAMAYDPVSNNLYVGGNFRERLMKWDGSNWSVIYYTGTTFLNGVVRTLYFYNGSLYVGGAFTNVGNYIARYNTSNNTWNTIGSGVSSMCFSITVSPYSGTVYIGARIDSTNSVIYQFKTTSTEPEAISSSFNGASNAINKILVISNNDNLLVGTSVNNYDGTTGKTWLYS